MTVHVEGSDNAITPVDAGMPDGDVEPSGELTSDQTGKAEPDASEGEIVIKQVPVDGICGGY